MKSKLIYYLTLFLFFAYGSTAQIQKGLIEQHAIFYGVDKTTNKLPFEITTKILIKEGYTIQSVPLITFSLNPEKKETKVIIDHYSFIDEKKGMVCDYKQLSDTSVPLKKYQTLDSIGRKGGWNYLSKEPFTYNSSKKLKDTIINGVAYGRLQLDKRNNNQRIYLVLYYRCDKKDIRIRLFNGISDSLGCPVIRDDTFVNDKLFMTRELEFISDHLSPEEEKIFEAWKRNEEYYQLNLKKRRS